MQSGRDDMVEEETGSARYIPTYPLPPIKIEPKPEPIEVTELHEQMSRTGIFRVWDKWREKK